MTGRREGEEPRARLKIHKSIVGASKMDGKKWHFTTLSKGKMAAGAGTHGNKYV